MKSVIIGITFAMASSATAQTATTETSVREAYGARLAGPLATMPSQPNRRLSTRIANRISGRLSTRIERYREPGVDPVQSLVAPVDTKAATAPKTIAPVAQSEDDPN